MNLRARLEALTDALHPGSALWSRSILQTWPEFLAAAPEDWVAYARSLDDAGERALDQGVLTGAPPPSLHTMLLTLREQEAVSTQTEKVFTANGAETRPNRQGKLWTQAQDPLSRRKPQVRTNTKIEVTICSTTVLRHQERQDSVPSPRLQTAQRGNSSRLLATTSHLRSHA